MRWLKVFFLALTFAVLPLSGGDVLAQCPMCKMSAESNLRNGGDAGRGLNAGILYLLVLPYAAVGLLGYLWWRNRRKEPEEELPFSEN
ncbi:MAG: hypothetical protein D6765_09335 [Bacteroidetes bacterium]|nr:MAG: hypothetical protein D6765_09335 [Bacteroidota bacterium]